MGKRGKETMNQLPVDQYRKQIGKQEQKRLRNDLKEARRQSGTGSYQDSQQKFKEASVIGAAFIILIVMLYAGLLFYLEKR